MSPLTFLHFQRESTGDIFALVAADKLLPWHLLQEAEEAIWKTKGRPISSFPSQLIRTRPGKWGIICQFKTTARGTPLFTLEQKMRELFTQELEHLGRLAKKYAMELKFGAGLYNSSNGQ